MEFLTSGGWDDYVAQVQRRSSNLGLYADWTTALGLEMAFERSFVRAGGLLMAGADPTGWGGVLAGLADQRNVELLVEAGFSAEQAIQIATGNGAMFLGSRIVSGPFSAEGHAIRHWTLAMSACRR